MLIVKLNLKSSFVTIIAVYINGNVKIPVK